MEYVKGSFAALHEAVATIDEKNVVFDAGLRSIDSPYSVCHYVDHSSWVKPSPEGSATPSLSPRAFLCPSRFRLLENEAQRRCPRI
jgi:hypothetical protein